MWRPMTIRDGAIFVGVESRQQAFQLILIQVPFYFIVLIELLLASCRFLVQESPVHSKIQ